MSLLEIDDLKVTFTTADGDVNAVNGVSFHIDKGETLAIELEAPGMDVVGFEHAPKDANGKAKVWKALSLLENASAMFTLPKAAECTVGHVHAENETMETGERREHGHKDEGTSKESAAEESGSHSAFLARWIEDLPAHACNHEMVDAAGVGEGGDERDVRAHGEAHEMGALDAGMVHQCK